MDDLRQRILAKFITEKSVRTKPQLYNQVQPVRMGDLDDAIESLVTDGSLRRTFLVRSPVGDNHGLDEYDALSDVPDTMTDDLTEPPVDFTVSSALIEVRYNPGEAWESPTMPHTDPPPDHLSEVTKLLTAALDGSTAADSGTSFVGAIIVLLTDQGHLLEYSTKGLRAVATRAAKDMAKRSGVEAAP